MMPPVWMMRVMVLVVVMSLSQPSGAGGEGEVEDTGTNYREYPSDSYSLGTSRVEHEE